MGLLDRFRGPTPAEDSPCRRICALDPEARICRGCGRTAAEITGWSRMPRRDRRAVLAALPGRLADALGRDAPGDGGDQPRL